MSEELIASLKLDKQQFLDDVKEVKQNAESTSKDVDKINKEAEKQTDLTFLKAVQTVQKIERILMQALRMAGVGLTEVGRATVQTVNAAVATLIPLFSAQAMSGWMAAQAIMGMASLTISLINLQGLILSSQADNLLEMFFTSANTGIGRFNTFI